MTYPEWLVADGWIQTFNGHKFYPLGEEPGQIDIEDIAHALANECRYSGHCRYYSVAEHSVRLSDWVWHRFPELAIRRTLAKFALLHDASEAYLSDVPRPLKLLPEFAFYRVAEDRLQKAIYTRFGLFEEPEVIRDMDTEILGVEARALFSGIHPDWKDLPEVTDLFWGEEHGRILGWQPADAKERFLNRFTKYWPEERW